MGRKSNKPLIIEIPNLKLSVLSGSYQRLNKKKLSRRGLAKPTPLHEEQTM